MHGHPAPLRECECGIYAARDPEEARRYLFGRNDSCVVARVLGLVTLWGTVVEAERGWRASHAYPAFLDPSVADIARLYGVRVA